MCGEKAVQALFQRTFYGICVASGTINVSSGHIAKRYRPDIHAYELEAWFDSSAWTGAT